MQEYQGAVSGAALMMLNAVAEAMMAYPPQQRIGRNGSPYIDRWMLSRKALVPNYELAVLNPQGPLDGANWVPSLVENIYLHSYHRADADDPHDHPWANASLVIRGCYQETVFDEKGLALRSATRIRGDLVLRDANEIHAITSTSDDCLSLFFTLQKEREWGFWINGKFIPWVDYHREEHEVTGVPTVAPAPEAQG